MWSSTSHVFSTLIVWSKESAVIFHEPDGGCSTRKGAGVHGDKELQIV